MSGFGAGDHLEGQVNVTTSTMITSANQTGHEAGDDWLQTRPGERCLIRVSAAETNGAYSVVEIVSSPGDCTAVHVHQNEDEYILVLEGTARIVCGGRIFDAPAGASVALARNVPHAWGNPSNSPLRMLVTTTPGGIEDILRTIVQADNINLGTLSKEFEVQRVGPLLLEA
jgi:mannose-6-phosphate isomerase-like protein (cupin superfamily)